MVRQYLVKEISENFGITSRDLERLSSFYKILENACCLIRHWRFPEIQTGSALKQGT